MYGRKYGLKRIIVPIPTLYIADYQHSTGLFVRMFFLQLEELLQKHKQQRDEIEISRDLPPRSLVRKRFEHQRECDLSKYVNVHCVRQGL